jgi:hypothetical protein
MADIDRLESIKNIIENMNKCHQTEILKILIKKSTPFSENSNGIFVNLTDKSEDILVELENYIKFVNKQFDQLSYIEDEKANIKNEFFKSEKRNNIEKRNKATTSIEVT